MHFDVGTAIWLILVVIGVISSIVGKARKAAQQYQPAQVQPVGEPAAPAPWQSVAQAIPVHEQTFAVPEPVAAPPPVVIKRAQPKPVARETVAPAASVPEQQDGTMRFRGMFERRNLANAFVAAQVFGPPKALQEQSLWSPRHSEPSI